MSNAEAPRKSKAKPSVHQPAKDITVGTHPRPLEPESKVSRTSPAHPLNAVTDIQQRLQDWMVTVLGPVDFTSAAPGADPSVDVVLYLMNLAPSQEMRTAYRREPLQFGLRWLVTTQGEKAGDRLTQLLVAALERSEWQVELELPPEAWQAFGVPPRPALLLTVEVSIPRPQPRVALVLQPLEIEVVPTSQLNGQVVGPGSVPLPDVRVEFEGLNVHTYTDSGGRFVFAAVPMEHGKAKLRISAKGREFSGVADMTDGEPIVIRCDPLEE